MGYPSSVSKMLYVYTGQGKGLDTMAAPRRDAWRGGGGRGPFEVDSFHATHIGIRLNVENIAGTDPPSSPQCRRPWLETTPITFES